MQQIKFKKLSARAKTPSYAHQGDACFDLALLIDDANPPMYCDGDRFHDIKSPTDDGFPILSGESFVFHSGLSFEIPEGHVMLVFPRSSSGIKSGLVLSNGTGVIDSGYRGEVRIAIRNDGESTQWVTDGQRLAQAMVIPFPVVEFVEVDNLSESERGTGGIGSTGSC